VSRYGSDGEGPNCSNVLWDEKQRLRIIGGKRHDSYDHGVQASKEVNEQHIRESRSGGKEGP